MTDMIPTIRAIVQRELDARRIAELAVVTEVQPHADSGDSDNYSCTVKLKNSGLELLRVPVATGHIGTVAIPNVGDLVLLAFDRGDINQPIITGRLYNDEELWHLLSEAGKKNIEEHFSFAAAKKQLRNVLA